MKQTVDSRDQSTTLVVNGAWAELGSWEDFIYRHDESSSLDISLTVTSERAFLPEFSPSVQPPLTFSASFGYSEPSIHVTSLKLTDSTGRSLLAARRHANGHYVIEGDVAGTEPTRPLSGALDKFYRLRIRPESVPTSPRDPRLHAAMMFEYSLPRTIEGAFQSFYYLGPLRRSPQRFYAITGERPQDVGLAGERAIDVLTLRPKNRQERATMDVADEVDKWLRAFGMSASSRLAHIGRNVYYMSLQDPHTGVEVNLADVGFGVSQVLPIIVEVLFARRNSLVLLEQPEIHLNSRVQADLADLFIEASQTKSLLIETHSADLITRLRRRIAEEKISAKDVAVYYCEETDGGTALRELELTDSGQFVDWPAAFLSSELEDMFAQFQALADKARRAD